MITDMGPAFLIISGLVSAVCLILTTVALFLHWRHEQYKHIPGPKRSSFWLGNLSDVRRAIEKDNKFIAQVVTEYSKQYGNTFILWFIHKPVVFCIAPDAIKKALIVDNYAKSEEFSKTFGFILNCRFIGLGLITEFNHDRWFGRRTALNTVFSRKFLHGFMDLFNKSIDVFIMRLQKEADGKRIIELSSFLHRITLDIIGQVAFGVDFNTIHEINSPFPLALATALEGFQCSINHPGKALLPFCLRKERTATREACTLLRQTARQILLKHKQSIENNPTIAEGNVLTVLVKTHLLDGNNDIEIAIDDFISIFLAGQETSATVIGFAVIELCRNKSLLKRAVNEVDEVMQGVDQILDYDDLERLEFMHSVLRETLRLYPPAPLLFRQPLCQYELDGYRIPAGTGVSFGTYACGRSPEFTKDPEEFMPDRWRDGSPHKPASFAYFPFSLGPRNCIGKNFAMIEMKVLLAKLLYTFHIDLDMTQSFEAVDKTTLTPKDGVRCTLTPRTLSCTK